MAAPIYKSQDMLSAKQIAERWGMSLSFVYQLIEGGKLAAFKFGGSIRVHISKVLEFEEKAEFEAGVCLCWVVGRRSLADKKLTVPSDTWQLQGVTVNEADAVAMCRDETYFIGPVPFDCALPHEQAEWKGCYYPLAVV